MRSAAVGFSVVSKCILTRLGRGDGLVKVTKAKLIGRLAVGYLVVGFIISLCQNIFGSLTVFTWTGSIAGNLILFFWWFLVPALIWPWDLFWSVFHLVNR